MADWRPIAEARPLRYGTIADLKMQSGRVYRAVWGFRGRCCAWWPISAQRKKPMGLYEPASFRVCAEGIVPRDQWKEAAAINHASF